MTENIRGPLARATSLEPLSGISPKQFDREYARRGRPAVLQGAASAWRATEWDLDFFRDRFGDREFEVDGATYALAELMDLIEASTHDNPAPYLRNVNIGAEFAELLPDISPDLPHALPDRKETRFFPQHILHRGEGRFIQLFIGGEGRSFPRLHWDSPPFNTWSTLVYGSKEWILFPPEDTPYLYAGPAPDVSRVADVYDPDLEEFPLFDQTHPVRIVQKPGQSLFMPPGWWHTAKNLEPTISVASDQLSASSWPAFTRHFLEDRRGRPVYQGALAAYLGFAGACLSAKEAITG